MITTCRTFVAALLIGFAAKAQAQHASLKANGDLVIHPSQVAKLFGLASEQINTASMWGWPELQVDKPYKTTWSTVEAKGPFQLKLSTEQMGLQQLSVELDWSEPSLQVGRFMINDQIVKDMGGAKVVVMLNGVCTGMTLYVPGGAWKVKGRLNWVWNKDQIVAQWQDFEFLLNAQAPVQINMGQCEGAEAVMTAIKDAMQAVAHDQSWLQNMMKEATLRWVQNSLGSFQKEILTARTVTIRPTLTATWEPQDMEAIGEGMIRVPGQLSLKKEGEGPEQVEVVERTQLAASLISMTESGLVLPKNTIEKVVEFLHRNGELNHRVPSNSVTAFVGLMKSRFLQFFVWPDLMKFATNTTFYFDLRAQNYPSLTNGRMVTDRGLTYDLQVPLLVNMWAPHNGNYLPYVDFRAQGSGRVYINVKGNQLQLQAMTGPLNVRSQFRDEYKSVRAVSDSIWESLLGSRVQSYLSSQKFMTDLPEWPLTQNLILGVTDIQMWKQGLRVPLEVRKNN